MRLWLIPVRTGLPAVEAALEHVDASVPPTAEELRSLAAVALRYVLARAGPSVAAAGAVTCC